MTINDNNSLNEIEQIIKNCTKKPEIFLSVQEHISEDLKNATKHLYDLAAKTKSVKYSKSEALSELVINDFDSEQIWQQLELENNEEFGRLSLGNISKTLASKKSLVLPLKLTQDVDLNETDHSDDQNEELQEDGSEKLNDDLESEAEKTKTKEVTRSFKKRRRTTEVDDKFFKLDELDEYLKKEDKRETGENNKDNNSSDEENESIDLFNDIPESDENEDEDDEEIKNGETFKYADFFDSPESCDEGGPEKSEEEGNENYNDDDDDQDKFNNDISDSEVINKIQLYKQEKKVKFNLLDNSDEADSIEDFVMKEKDENKSKTSQSSLEIRQERLKKKIKELEKEAISEKPWQLKGETTATSRPQNSLLEEYVEFDTVSRPAPIMTEKTTMKLEDIIRQRIKDKAWDDVEKKFKPVETPMEYKKKLIMNQEKSKESLAQIYENEYIKQREALNTEDKDEQEKEEPPEHIEIRKRMHDLFKKLDALSNFHYTPKLAKPEIKIVSNVPAISMEEVAPVATSDATLLAPEEIQTKRKGDLLGKSERTKTDMKRERRKKKLQQHARAVHQSNNSVETVKQKKSLKTTGKLKARNIINMDDKTGKKDGKTIKSSTAFFAQLQDQVVSSIKAKTNTTTNKKNKSELSAVKLKL